VGAPDLAHAALGQELREAEARRIRGGTRTPNAVTERDRRRKPRRPGKGYVGPYKI